MTIKQLGGVFGRNPTFNDVTIEGQLTFDGDIDINSDLKVDGNLEVTGTSTLNGNLEIAKDNPKITLNDTDGGTQTDFSISANANVFSIYNETAAVNTLRIFGNTQDVRVETGNLVIATSGKGIDFSATAGTGTSELLDDYEEGAWTPNYTAATGGNLGGTQSRQGYYTKVGNKVTVQFYLYINTIDVTGKSGDVTVTGLPFTGSLGVNATGSLVVTEDTGQYGAFTNSPRTMKLSGSGDSLVLLKEISSNVEQPLQVTDFATGGGNRNIIRASFTYIV